MKPTKTIAFCGPVKWGATIAADGNGAKTFEMLAYSGGAMALGWGAPVYIDLAGMTVTAKARPILRQHDPLKIVGHTSSIDIRANSEFAVNVAGVISGTGSDALEVAQTGANGFPWQASVGARVLKTKFIPEGESSNVNGQSVSGPAYVVLRSSLSEVSFVPLGADDATSAKIAAEAAESDEIEMAMTPEEIAAKAKLDSEIKAKAEADKDSPDSGIATLRSAHAAESVRIGEIRAACGGNHFAIEAKAIAEGWTAEKTHLEVLRAERATPNAPAIIVRSNDAAGAQTIEAALCLAGRLPNVEKIFDSKVLEGADRMFKSSIGLQEILLIAAAENGKQYRSIRGNEREVLKAAFSTQGMTGILSAVANKFMLAGFMAVENVWREITAVRNVNDFKQINSYRLNGGFEYDEVPASGELKHGDISDTTYTNQAKTYGKMFQISRADIINDDLSALTQLPARIGRGGALKLNKVFWTEFMANSSFFSSGNSNYISGATTNLSIDSLTLLEQKFLDQTDVDGNPMATAAALLLVPTAIKSLAGQLMMSAEMSDCTTNARSATLNPHAGKWKAICSAYLSNATITGYSSTKFYLLANPLDGATIEVAFLNGVEVPTVQTAEADFNQLGIQMRGFHDFGVKKQEYRFGAASKGAA